MSNRPTYPGIIPYRSSSPSYPDAGDANMPELIKVNHNFSLRRPQSSSLMSKKFQSLSNLQKENGGGEADVRSYKDDELRDRYFEYWAEQQVRIFDDIFFRIVMFQTGSQTCLFLTDF